MTQRGLPRKGAASSLSCAGALPPQSAEENLCRVPADRQNTFTNMMKIALEVAVKMAD